MSNSIEDDAKKWLELSKTKSKALGTKIQRAQLAAIVLAALIPINRGVNKYALAKEAFEWADVVIELS